MDGSNGTTVDFGLGTGFGFTRGLAGGFVTRGLSPSLAAAASSSSSLFVSLCCFSLLCSVWVACAASAFNLLIRCACNFSLCFLLFIV